VSERTGSALFKEYLMSHPSCDYRAYWSYNPNDRAGGVGIFLKEFVSKYVQRVYRFNARAIAIDLFLSTKN